LVRDKEPVKKGLVSLGFPLQNFTKLIKETVGEGQKFKVAISSVILLDL
jgi:hypothetical protein